MLIAAPANWLGFKTDLVFGPYGCPFKGSDSVEPFKKYFARFEEGNPLWWHFDSGSRFWIAADARSSLAPMEGSESADFNFFVRSQGADDTVKYAANDDVGLLPGHLQRLRNLFG